MARLRDSDIFGTSPSILSQVQWFWSPWKVVLLPVGTGLRCHLFPDSFFPVSAPSVSRGQANARPSTLALANTAFHGQAAWVGILSAATLLWDRQQGVSVAMGLNRKMFIRQLLLWTWDGDWCCAGHVVDRIPESGCGLSSNSRLGPESNGTEQRISSVFFLPSST